MTSASSPSHKPTVQPSQPKPRLRLIPLDDTVVFPNMGITLTIDVGDDERVVLVITGEGLKTLDAVRGSFETDTIDPTLESFTQNVAEAVAWFQRVLADRVAVLGADHPGTVAARRDLGQALMAAARPGEAVTVLGGLVSSTILNLLVLPALARRFSRPPPSDRK